MKLQKELALDFIRVLEDGNVRHPLWFDARQAINAYLEGLLDELKLCGTSPKQVYMAGRSFKFAGKEGFYIIFSERNAINLFKDYYK